MTSFEDNIKQWVSIDNELKKINEKAKILRDQKNNLSQSITNYATNNKLLTSLIQISDGKLKFGNNKLQEPLTFKYLEKCLLELYQDQEKVNKILSYIKQNRESKSVSEIKRFYN